MKKREFKAALFEVLNLSIDGMSYEAQMTYAEKLLIDFQKDNEEKRDTTNKGKK